MASYDLVVGVDLGMTSTGVAYKAAKSSGIWHMKWTSCGDVFEKCPTTLEYEVNKDTNHIALKACGVNCVNWFQSSAEGRTMSDQHVRYVEWFKLFLEPAYLRTAIARRIPWAPTSEDEVFQWFVDYLTFLYQEIRNKIQSTQTLSKAWESSSIHFHFTYPHFWSIQARNRYRDSIRIAGFETGEHHKITINLTEAEASAIHVIQENPCVLNGNTLLVMDVGGGTTDVVKFQAQFQVDNTLRCHNLEPMQEIIGFSDVDKAWEDHVYRLLFALPHFREKEHDSPGWIRQVAVGMRRSRWLKNHVHINQPAIDSDFIFLPSIKEIAELFTDHITDHTIIIKSQDIRRCLEVVSQPLIGMLRTVAQAPDYFAFVGGVADTKICESVTNWVHGNWRATKVLRVENPALAPSTGAIYDRFAVSTKSVGVVTKNSIEWLIRQGENVSQVKFKDSFPTLVNKHNIVIVTTDQGVAELPSRLLDSRGLEVHTVSCRLKKKKLMGLTYNLTISVTGMDNGIHIHVGSEDSSVVVEPTFNPDERGVRLI